VLICQKDVRKKVEVAKKKKKKRKEKKDHMGFYLGPSTSEPTHRSIVSTLPSSADAPFCSSPTRAQRRSGSALSDGGAVPGSAAASGPQRRRGSLRLAGGVSGSPARFSRAASRPRLRPPRTDRRPCVRTPSPLPPLLYRGSPASCPGWSGLGSAGAFTGSTPNSEGISSRPNGPCRAQLLND